MKKNVVNVFLVQVRAILFLVVGMFISILIFGQNKNNNVIQSNHHAPSSSLNKHLQPMKLSPPPSTVAYPQYVYGKAPRLLVGILSTADNFKRRKVIRETWLNIGANLNWEPFFIVGKSNDAKKQKQVVKEAHFHRDMIIFNHIQENYYTISEKVEAFFTWSLNAWGGKNNHPQFFMKTDDDCAIEIPMLFEALKHLPSHKLYMGRPRENAKVIRPGGKRAKEKYAQKWTVTKKEYSKDYFPPYMGGPGYILSYDIVLKMVDKIKKRNKKHMKPFKFEDVNIGILLDGIDYELRGKRSFFLEPTKWDKKWIGSTHTFVHHRVSEKEMEQFALEKKLNPELPWRRFGESGKGGKNVDNETGDKDKNTVDTGDRAVLDNKSKDDEAVVGDNNKDNDNVLLLRDTGSKNTDIDIDDNNMKADDFTIPLLHQDLKKKLEKKDLFRDQDNSGNKKSYFKHFSFNPPPKLT
jgi:hypothetical protein